jgi:glycosyltransferase involved in cell wall biosynthesis
MPTKTKQKNFLSACIVTYNDEACIERCLRSISALVDEIVIVHDGPCLDKTLEIAKRYTKNITVGPRLGNPDPHRVTTFKKAKGNWLLIIDADEFLSPQLQRALRKVMDSDQAEQYNFLWKLWDGKKYVSKTWPYRISLVKKNKLRYLAILHPDWSIKGKIINVPLHLEHRPPYNNFSWLSFRTKWMKWMRLHAEQILTPISELPQFQFDDSHFVKHIEWIKKYDFIAAPFIFVYFLTATFLLAPKLESLIIYKYNFMQALYYFLLSIQVGILKRKTRNA